MKEETGIDIEVVRLIGLFDGLRLGFTRTPLYSLVFHCRAVGGELAAHPLECEDVGWFLTRRAARAAHQHVAHWGEHALATKSGRGGRRPLRPAPARGPRTPLGLSTRQREQAHPSLAVASEVDHRLGRAPQQAGLADVLAEVGPRAAGPRSYTSSGSTSS